MGMDLFGCNPDSRVGREFNRNITGWSALWGYCVSVSPEAASLGERGFLNDGDGLNAEDAKKLAVTLREQLAIGATKNTIRAIDRFELAPPVPATVAAFIREFPDGFVPRNKLSEGAVRDFVEFLEHCGGFEIW